MNMGQRQEEFLIFMLMALGAGIAFGFAVPDAPFMPLMAVLAFFLTWAAWCIYRASKQVWTAFLLGAFFLGVLRFSSSMLLPSDDISYFTGQELQVAGRLTEAPQVKERSDGSVSVRYCLQAEKIRSQREGEQRVSGNLYVYARAAKEAMPTLPQIGDMLFVRGSLRLPHGFHNPGQINTELLLRSQGITATLLADKGGLTAKALPESEVSAWTSFLRRLAAIRAHYLSAMQAAMPKEDAAAIFAMLFGGYQGLKPELLESFTATGIVHILSVSGSHISLLAAVMAWLGALLRLPRLARVVLVVSTIAIYSMLAGPVPPVIRSALMGGLVSVGRKKPTCVG